MKTTTVKENGFQGILYPGNGTKDKVILVISGSDGGMKLSKLCARFYHENGIPALAMALFATEETQPYLDRVPLEYAEHAISWLKGLGYRSIGIDGMSKGSEYALLAASMLPELSCVIVRVPSHFVSEGLSGEGKDKHPSGTSCWSYRGKELPYAPYKVRTFNMLKTILKEKQLYLLDFNKEKDVTAESLIPIAQIKAPVLMLSSKQDSVWPSYQSAQYMEQCFSKSGFPYPHKHIAFSFMSHALLTELSILYRLGFRSERVNAEECAHEREHLKKELLDWVNTVWNSKEIE